MSDASIGGEVRRLAVPAILSSLLQTLVFVVDRVMLGHHAESSLAAMQIAGPIEWSLWSVFTAFEVGTIARVGRHVGAGDMVRARRAALLSFGGSLVAGLLAASLWPLFGSHVAAMFPDASPAAVGEARAYLAWTLSASPVVFASATAIAVLQASGDARTPLVAGVVANVVHVALNRALILGVGSVPAMGMRGAGISTAVTFGFEAAVTIGAIAGRRRRVSLLRADGASAAPPGAYADEGRALVHVAAPAVAERVLYHAGFLAYVWIIGRLGDVVMAANQSLLSVESICFLSADGFGIAAAALVAQKLGAGTPLLGARAARISVRYAVVLLTTVGLAFLVARWWVLPLFSRDADVVAIGAAAAPVLAVVQPFMATAIVLAQSLRGAGMTRAVLGVSATCAFVVRIACTWLFAVTLHLGLVGVWMGSTCDWIARSALLVWIARTKERAFASS